MASATITLPRLSGGGGNVTVTSRNFSAADQQTFRNGNYQSLRNQIGNRFGDLDAGGLGQYGSDTIIVAPTTARLWRSQNNQPHWNKVKKALRKALEVINKGGFNFPNNRLEVYIDETHDLSLGFVYQHGGGAQKVAIALGKTAVNTSDNAMNINVAWEVYNHYEPTYSVNPLERHIQTIVFHEIGHVLHQLSALDHYILLARCCEVGGTGISVEAVQDGINQNAAKCADFNPAPTAATLRDFIKSSREHGADVSNYAYQLGMNEFVAETFAAQIMGVAIGSDNNALSHFSGKATQAQILAAYQQCGGPAVPGAICHVRSHASRARLP